MATMYGRWLEAKYGGECAECGAPVALGDRAHWGADRTLACGPCGEARQHTPVNAEVIRAARQAKADKRAERMLSKAARLERDATPKVEMLHGQDYAWATQPTNRSTSGGRAFANQRDKIRARADAGMRDLLEADKLRQHAEWTRRQGVAVKGDAERRYQERREAQDARLGVGARVMSIISKLHGTITRVYPKSYRVTWENPPAWHPSETTEDKLTVLPALAE